MPVPGWDRRQRLRPAARNRLRSGLFGFHSPAHLAAIMTYPFGPVASDYFSALGSCLLVSTGQRFRIELRNPKQEPFEDFRISDFEFRTSTGVSVLHSWRRKWESSESPSSRTASWDWGPIWTNQLDALVRP